MSLLKTFSPDGKDFFVNVNAIMSVQPTGPSSAWHGHRSTLKTITGDRYECGENAASVMEKIARIQASQTGGEQS
ncbi:hypothetical protein [Chitinasiproducens palmae]|uniref:Uncharacterized protein n=1 Tax=Chitinasiproducens palmae TaxID=1770053 RepID=A0A1H2PS55_9BURK|nr:hypothetical protein [Chitinasiproducens palmae]SDV49780.1 hypothetical protein SAMN05216551_109128 [Chitinasiproducens palmae]